MTDTTERTVEAPAAPAPDRSIWYRLYHGETTFDFVGRRRIGFAISGVLLLLTVVSLFGRQLNLGIDFEGGVSWETPSANLDQGKVESILDGAADHAACLVMEHRDALLRLASALLERDELNGAEVHRIVADSRRSTTA